MKGWRDSVLTLNSPSVCIALLGFFIVASLTCGGCTNPNYTERSLPNGILGVPMGKYVTIEGECGYDEHSELTLLVLKADTLDGKKLDSIRPVALQGTGFPWPFGNPPIGKRLTLRGYEWAKLAGISPDDRRVKNDSNPDTTHLWLATWFQVKQVLGTKESVKQ